MEQSLRYPINKAKLFFILFILCFVSAPQANEMLAVLETADSDQVVKDPLMEEMTVTAIQSRLKMANEKISDITIQQRDNTLDKRYAQWQRVTELLEIEMTLVEVEKNLLKPEIINAPSESPPFSISYLDYVREKYHSFKTSYALLEQETSVVQNRISVAQSAYNKARSALHQLEEESAPEEEKIDAGITLQIAKEVFISVRLDSRLTNSKLKVVRKNVARWSEWLPKVESQVEFSTQDFNNFLENIRQRRNVLKNALIVTKQEVNLELDKPQEQQYYIKRLYILLDLLNEAISYLPKERGLWEERRDLYLGKVDEKKMVDNKQRVLLEQEQLIKLLQVKELRSERQGRIVDIEGQEKDKKSIALEKDILFHRELAHGSLHALSNLLSTYIADLENIENTRQIFYLKENAAHIANTLWSFEIAVVQDRAITVGKIIRAIVFFTVAVYLTRFILLKLLHTLLLRMNISEGGAFMASNLLYYLLLFIFLFVAISSAGIPLAVFALFGGALAIAAGFGSQKIINNFLSGIILLVERSIQVGDMVEVNETKGRIKKIGLRSVQIKTFDNVDILVPNSKFLEEDVINWTLESNLIKSNIEIQVDFDADSNKIIKGLTEAATNHPKVLPEKEVKTFLEEFNSDNGYMRFKLYFWIRMLNPEEKLAVESDLRQTILQSLHKQGIKLAIPALDVALNKENTYEATPALLKPVVATKTLSALS